MICYIDETSFSPPFDNEGNALSHLKELIAMGAISLELSNLKPIRRHANLADIFILENIPLRSFIFSLKNSKDPKNRDLVTIFLTSFVQGPYIENKHQDCDSLTDEKKTCMKDSCVDEAVSNFCGAALLSLDRDSYQTGKRTFASSRFGNKTLRNFSKLSQIQEIVWEYECNRKHSLKKDTVVEGLIHSSMKLTDKEAKLVLRNGVKCGKSIFSKAGDQWYKFHKHSNNLYHGFPITPKTPPQDFSNALKFFKEVDENENGQFFYEDLI